MSTLYETTIKQIHDSDMPLSQIAKGADVGYRWLVDLVNGRFKDPGVNRIERVSKYLSTLTPQTEHKRKYVRREKDRIDRRAPKVPQ